jgi:hypothetical protein
MELSEFRKLSDDEKLEIRMEAFIQKMEAFIEEMKALKLDEMVSRLESRFSIPSKSPFKTPPLSPIRPTHTSIFEISDITFQKFATPSTPSCLPVSSLDDTTFEEDSNYSYYSDGGYYSDDVPCSEDCPISEDCHIHELEYLVPKSYTPTPDDEDSEADQYDEDPPAYTFDDSDDEQFETYDDDDPREQDQDQFSVYDDDDPQHAYEDEDQLEDEDETYRDY